MDSFYLTNIAPVDLEEVVFDDYLNKRITDFLDEYIHSEILEKYHLQVANKLFLYGKTGCGKTMTAKAIAHRLNKKIYIVNLSSIVSSKLGETAKNISELFKTVQNRKAVLFFDEFDSLGSMRDYDNQDASEMKRVVNTILQLIDDFPKDAVLIAATNQIQLIDEALIRRFDLKLEFGNPPKPVLDQYYTKLLDKYPTEFTQFERIYEVSFAEAKNWVFEKVKEKIIQAEKQKSTQKN